MAPDWPEVTFITKLIGFIIGDVEDAACGVWRRLRKWSKRHGVDT